MRVLKSLALRFLLVFLGCLLLSLVLEHFYSSSPVTMAILDRRYQLTLEKLKGGRKRVEEYGDYKIKRGSWAALTNQTLCLAGEDNKVVLAPCQLQSPLQKWSIHYSRDPDRRDHVSLPAVTKCVDVGAVTQPRGTPLILYGCHGGGSQELSFDFTSQMIYHGESNNCLELAEGGEVKIQACNLKKRDQKWIIFQSD